MRISSASNPATSVVALLLCLLSPFWAAADPVNLNLSSTTASIPQTGATHPVVISVGGHSMLVKPGDLLTPAQFAAARQVLSNGTQSLVLSASGNATAGNIALGAFQNIGALTIPTGVSASVLATGVSAADVIVRHGGIISTANIGGSGMDLSIYAAGIIQNEGTLSSSRNLNLVANMISNLGGTIGGVGDVSLTSRTGTFTNTGTISSTNGSVSFSSANAPSLNIDSTAGSISAAKNVSLYGGTGDIRAALGSVIGTVNAYGATAHVSALSDMAVGTVNTTGDPVFQSPTDLTINTNQILNGQDLSLLAGHNIIAAPGVNLIDLSSRTARGGNLTLVAGVNFTADTPSAGDFTFNSFNANGGNISLGSVTIKLASTAAGFNGGGVNAVANGGTTNVGSIQLGSVDTTSKGGIGGDLFLLGPGQHVVKALNASGQKGGFFSVTGATVTTSGIPVILQSGAASGGSFVANTSAPNSSLTVNGTITLTGSKANGGGFFVTAGKDVLVTGKILTSTFADANSGQIGVSTQTGNVLFRDAAITSSTVGHGGMVNVTVNVGSGGLEINKGLDTSGKTGGGDVVVNAYGDINIGFNPQINAPTGSTPLLILHNGGLNTSSSTMAAGGIDLATQLGKISIAKDVNASGFANAGHFFTMSPGFVRIDGNINTSSKTEDGKPVSINSGSGAQQNPLFGTDVGSINTSGFDLGGAVAIDAGKGHVIVRGPINTHAVNGPGGNVDLNSLYETMVLGPISTNGTTAGGHVYITSGAAPTLLLTASGSTLINGTINTSATQAPAGDVTILSSADLTTGGIKAVGTSTAMIDLRAPQGQLKVTGDIDGSILTAATGPGGYGSTLNIGAGSLVTITGNVKLAGGNAIAGSGGHGGVLGSVFVVDPNYLKVTASIIIGGAVDVRGGNGLGPAATGGTGGSFLVVANTLRILGSSAGGASINASGGLNAAKLEGPEGLIQFGTNDLQPIPSNFDFASTKKTQPVFPGGLFEIGNATVNGTASVITTKSGNTLAKGTNVFDTRLDRGRIDIVTIAGAATINENGPVVVLRTVGADGKRMFATPTEAVVLYEATHGLSAVPSNVLPNGTAAANAAASLGPNEFEVNAIDMSRSFTAFNIANGSATPNTINLTIHFGYAGTDNAQMHFTGTPNIVGSLILKDDALDNEQLTMELSNLVVGLAGRIDSQSTMENLALMINASKPLNIANNGLISVGTIAIRNTGGDTNIALGPSAVFGNVSAFGAPLVNIEEGLGGTYKGSVTISGPATSLLRGSPAIYATKIQIGQTVAINGGYNSSPKITQIGDLEALNKISIASSDVVDAIGHIYGQSDVTLLSNSFTFLFHNSVIAQKSITLGSNNAVGLNGVSMVAAKDITLIAPNIFNAVGPATIESTAGSIRANSVGGAIDFSIPPTNTFKALGDISLTSTGDVSFSGTADAKGFVTLGTKAGAPFPCSGTVTTDGTINGAKGINIDVRNSGGISLGGILTSSLGDVHAKLSDSAAFDMPDVTVVQAHRDIIIESSSSSDIMIGANEQLLAQRNVQVTQSDPTASIVMGAGNVIRGGEGSIVPLNSTVLQSNVITAGGITMNAGKDIMLGSFTTISSFGGDIRLTAQTGDIALGDQSSFTAQGGNLSILAKGVLNGGSTTAAGPYGNVFYASSLVNGTKFTGGGVELRAGTTVSTISQEVANRPIPFSNLIDASNAAKVLLAVAPAKGKIFVGPTGGINLTTTKDGTHGIFFDVPAQVVNPVVIVQASPGGTINLNSVQINSVTPIGRAEDESTDEPVLDTDFDSI
jgi:hypothetical protein